ncbi:hypothetical protein CEXT_609281 [Caerostris extrusa]|uniref:Uncharacterized protein n=1 Tax=Caerostris extrusa TaxID=172846 RepID=A0AAV4SLM0_CAEEX|nr:hypothetical protein CEXT_609281 [Caerostris extrusa]
MLYDGLFFSCVYKPVASLKNLYSAELLSLSALRCFKRNNQKEQNTRPCCDVWKPLRRHVPTAISLFRIFQKRLNVPSEAKHQEGIERFPEEKGS